MKKLFSIFETHGVTAVKIRHGLDIGLLGVCEYQCHRPPVLRNELPQRLVQSRVGPADGDKDSRLTVLGRRKLDSLFDVFEKLSLLVGEQLKSINDQYHTTFSSRIRQTVPPVHKPLECVWLRRRLSFSSFFIAAGANTDTFGAIIAYQRFVLASLAKHRHGPAHQE